MQHEWKSRNNAHVRPNLPNDKCVAPGHNEASNPPPPQ